MMNPSPLGYCASVRLAPVARALAAGRAFAEGVLAGREKELWARCVTGKRRVEFVGGRVAAKLCAALYRAAVGASRAPLNAIEVYPLQGRRPVCLHDDGLTHPVSISHSGGWAMALVPLGPLSAGLDIETAGSRVRPSAHFFTGAELSQIDGAAEARLRWTLKEAYGKLTGDGVLAHTHDVQALRQGGGMWLAAPERVGRVGGCLLAGGTCGALTVAVGLDVRHDLTGRL